MPKDTIPIYKYLSLAEKGNVSKSKAFYGKEIQNYSRCFDLLDDVIEHVCELSIRKKIVYDGKDIAFCTICQRVVLTSKVYLDLAMKGYYYDAEIIVRSLYENLYFMLSLMNKDKKTAEEIAEKWMNRKLDMKKIKESLGIFSNESMRQINAELNDCAHSNFPAIARFITKKGVIENTFQLIGEPTFRPDYGLEAFDPFVATSSIQLSLENFKPLLETEFYSWAKNAVQRMEKRALKLKEKNNIVHRQNA